MKTTFIKIFAQVLAITLAVANPNAAISQNKPIADIISEINSVLERMSLYHPLRHDGPWNERDIVPLYTDPIKGEPPDNYIIRQRRVMDAREKWNGRKVEYKVVMEAEPNFKFCNVWYEDQSRNPRQEPMHGEENYVGVRLIQASPEKLTWQVWLKPSGAAFDQKRTWIKSAFNVVWVSGDVGAEDRKAIGCGPIPATMQAARPFEERPAVRDQITIDTRPTYHWTIKANCQRQNWFFVHGYSRTSCEDARVKYAPFPPHCDFACGPGSWCARRALWPS